MSKEITVTDEEREMTALDFVRHIFGPCSKDEADSVLWTCTAFPVCSVKRIKKQLLDIKEKSGGDVGKALAIADAETEAAMNSPIEEAP